ncbi:hypothetical protein EV182_000682, partial [Spiromyces aspiralis]
LANTWNPAATPGRAGATFPINYLPHPPEIDEPYPEAPSDGYLTASFYSFIDIPKSELPEMRTKLLKTWKEDFGIVGRIYIWHTGINAQMSIPRDQVKDFRVSLEEHDVFRGKIPPFNWAVNHGRAFKSLHIRIRPLVAAGEEYDLEVISHQPTYLTAQEWDRELNEMRSKDKPVTLIDMRNFYEYGTNYAGDSAATSDVGRFEGAMRLDVDTFREQIKQVADICKDKDKPVYMYCTGGIRCSVAGAILKSKGCTNVKTLKGGVIAYGRHVKDGIIEKSRSTYKGLNFTFDKRLGERITDDTLAKCFHCGGPCDIYTNCSNGSCNLLFIQCPSCAKKYQHTCGNPKCIERVKADPETIQNLREPPMWNYRQRVRPYEAFRAAGIALKQQQQQQQR